MKRQVFWYQFETEERRELVWIMTNKSIKPGIKITGNDALGHIEFSFFNDKWFLFSHGPGKRVCPIGCVEGLKNAKLMLYLYCYA